MSARSGPSQEPSSSSTDLAVLIADLSGSTRLYDRLGDEQAREIVVRSLDILRGVVVAGGGAVVEVVGDELLATFPDAQAAVVSACAMQTRLAEAMANGVDVAPIRTGLNHGPVWRDGESIYGDTVNVAARMVALAKRSQILMTRDALDALPETLRTTTRPVDHTFVRGKEHAIEIHEALWQQEEITTLHRIPAARAVEGTSDLVLRLAGVDFRIGEGLPRVSIGRHDDADLTVRHELTSRDHARIVYRHGRFFLVDQSTNGTVVVDAAGQRLYVRRDEIVLEGTGSIGAGFDPDDDRALAIEYEVGAEPG